MLNRQLLAFLTAILCISMTTTGCGRRTTAPTNTDNIEGGPAGSDAPVSCDDANPCAVGECIEGVCVAPDGPTPCSSNADCPSDEFCHFPAATSYDATVPGECSPLCASDNDCHIGQQCIDGICFSNYDCTPGNGNCECPPGEVCNAQLNTCNAPPTTCYFVEQCPCDWICNTDNTCVNPADLGNCVSDVDCNSIAGCENNGCTCNEGSCQPSGMCTSAEDCPSGTYCQNGVCQEANQCTSDNDCLAYGLVCENGYCVNPPACGSDADCPEDEWCNTNFNPPGCFPDEFGGCIRDDQCLGGQYCNLFSGTCEDGCRNDTDCVGQCAGASICSCNAMHQCIEGSLQGASCTDNTQCPGGTVCAPSDADDVNCLGPFEGLLGPCEKSCLVVCDILMSQISTQCPTGETCQTPGGVMGALMGLMGGANGQQSETVGVCYPQ